MSRRAFDTFPVAKCTVLSCACVSLFFSGLFLTGCQDGGKSFRKALRGAATGTGSSRGMLGDRKKTSTKVQKGDSKSAKKKEQQRPTHKDAILNCPDGGRLAGSPPPRNNTQWCEAKGPEGKAVRHGPYRKWHKNGNLKESGYFEMGLPHGNIIKRSANGTIIEERHFLEGKANGPRIKYDKGGTRRSYISFREGKKHGKYMKWGRDGVLKERGVYSLDQKHGEWYTFHRNGQIRNLTTYRAGKKSGATEDYSKDGALIAQGEYRDNQQVGRWVSYFKDGTPKSDGSFKDGQKHGQWITYKKGGAIRKAAVYENGIVVQQDSPRSAVANARQRRGRTRGKSFGSRDILGAEPPIRRPVTPAPLQPNTPLSDSGNSGGWEPL